MSSSSSENITATLVEHYTAVIYVGTKHTATGELCPLEDLYAEITRFVNQVKLCVSVVENRYFYVDGEEPGIQVTIINYPRFPKERKQIRELALSLAHALQAVAKQQRVSIDFPEDTVMLGEG